MDREPDGGTEGIRASRGGVTKKIFRCPKLAERRERGDSIDGVARVV